MTDNNEVLTSLRPEKEEKDEYFEEKTDVVISLNSSQPSATSQEMHNVSFSNFKPITYNAISILYLFKICSQLRQCIYFLPLPKIILFCRKIQTKSKQSPGNSSELPDCLLNMKFI